jgi:hypothetical protein
VIYFTGGTAGQYKSKKYSNLAHHKENFNLEAEWLFFTTSHGKGTGM